MLKKENVTNKLKSFFVKQPGSPMGTKQEDSEADIEFQVPEHNFCNFETPNNIYFLYFFQLSVVWERNGNHRNGGNRNYV